ncbi:1046_t:CDS:2 [Cetraspora pellucida]|uniref:1046_t:CDS:1 n=1 Tax=Cetraspora pellucida TaxID=1433469 RepID=A0A9N9HJW0_9GLOM|nr:1046_t:CDS:2 [Cetraspora pellucida]
MEIKRRLEALHIPSYANTPKPKVQNNEESSMANNIEGAATTTETINLLN